MFSFLSSSSRLYVTYTSPGSLHFSSNLLFRSSGSGSIRYAGPGDSLRLQPKVTVYLAVPSETSFSSGLQFRLLSGRTAGLQKSGGRCIIDVSVQCEESLKRKASDRESKVYSV